MMAWCWRSVSLGSGVVPDMARKAVNQFLKEFEMLKAGKNPDGVYAFDD
jgi:hypothetical protein